MARECVSQAGTARCQQSMSSQAVHEALVNIQNAQLSLLAAELKIKKAFPLPPDKQLASSVAFSAGEKETTTSSCDSFPTPPTDVSVSSAGRGGDLSDRFRKPSDRPVPSDESSLTETYFYQALSQRSGRPASDKSTASAPVQSPNGRAESTATGKLPVSAILPERISVSLSTPPEQQGRGLYSQVASSDSTNVSRPTVPTIRDELKDEDEQSQQCDRTMWGLSQAAGALTPTDNTSNGTKPDVRSTETPTHAKFDVPSRRFKQFRQPSVPEMVFPHEAAGDFQTGVGPLGIETRHPQRPSSSRDSHSYRPSTQVASNLGKTELDISRSFSVLMTAEVQPAAHDLASISSSGPHKGDCCLPSANGRLPVPRKELERGIETGSLSSWGISGHPPQESTPSKLFTNGFRIVPSPSAHNNSASAGVVSPVISSDNETSSRFTSGLHDNSIHGTPSSTNGTNWMVSFARKSGWKLSLPRKSKASAVTGDVPAMAATSPASRLNTASQPIKIPKKVKSSQCTAV